MSAAARLLDGLARHYGRQAPPPLSGPFEMILWEIVAYLANDEQRQKAFDALRERVGLSPKRILDADEKVLVGVTRMGGAIAAGDRAGRLREASRLVIEEFQGDLNSILRLPTPKAKKALMRFPMIGEPGAEKILLFSGVLAVLALESNGLRVLERTGIVAAGKSYQATYKAARVATLEQLPADGELLKQAYLLLRRHGQEICRAKDPVCGGCALGSACAYFQARSA